MQKFTYGPEAIDYFQCRLREDPDVLTSLLSDIDLGHQGVVTAELPLGVDTAKLYKFRTDIFWGWPEEPGREVYRSLVDFLLAFLGNVKPGLIISQTWPDTDPEHQAQELPTFRYPSVRKCAMPRLCRFVGPFAQEEGVRHFLKNTNRTPLILADCSCDPKAAEAITDGREVTMGRETLAAIARNAAHIIVDVYDGRANLVWSRMSPQDMRARWQAGNVGIV